MSEKSITGRYLNQAIIADLKLMVLRLERLTEFAESSTFEIREQAAWQADEVLRDLAERLTGFLEPEEKELVVKALDLWTDCRGYYPGLDFDVT